jgi:integrase
LGFKLSIDERHLRAFIAFLESKKTSHITTRLALEFVTFRKDLDPRSWVQRLCAVRAFALYWQGFDPKTEVPPVGLLRYPAKRARPRFCSEAQIVRLLELARGVPSTGVHGLRPWTLYTLFGLLSVSGMRISEALHLKSTDIDWDAGVLTVRLTKFGKSRLVPLHPSTVQALAEYALRRDGFLERSGRPCAVVVLDLGVLAVAKVVVALWVGVAVTTGATALDFFTRLGGVDDAAGLGLGVSI